MKRIFLLLTFLLGLCVHLHAELFFTQQMINSHLKNYSEEEIQLIKKDLNVVRSVCFEGTKNTENRFYIATAGGPGSRKTTILEKFISARPEYQDGVYLDPDPRALKFMVHTYHAKSLNNLVISTTNNYDQVIKNAYEKWRAASNFITVTLLEEAFDAGRNVVHGTTSTGSHLADFYTALKQQDYEIILLLCSCPDEVRYEAVDYRNRVVRFYQSSPEDAVAKGLVFPQKMESYFKYADRLHFFWSDTLFSNERLAGTWSEGKLEIHDPDAMQHFIDKYEADRKTLQEKGVTIPSFENLITQK